jgi:hypothetical protein
MNEFSNPWRDCPSCYQYYQNKLAIDWRPSLTHLSEGSIQAIRKCRWNLLMWNCLLSIRCLSVCNLGKRESWSYCKCDIILDWSDERRCITAVKALFPISSVRIQHTWSYCSQRRNERECKKGCGSFWKVPGSAWNNGLWWGHYLYKE